ncbi:hydroxyisourate hydrolase [Enterovibrio nigricans]|uniref:5-hydroxyisourate hydrolase n=1 Tax=Enterovibrio nigricans DSM 22720 TaxID=1121868 RepID=A0A1T4VHR5_9GAMM|nr:hydroxyisourate hydrolase [Enterovibrio nigricans]PKF49418.1 hydroxyisourate hydrolase [Enterovibrio nigricans]SKA64091.1 5-hydroxyisourate hydrolase [Enterovibrio nigricans DSM 22720]
MGRLTTHVLDTAQGKPGADIDVSLYRVEGDTLQHVVTTTTNSDGRTDEPLLDGSHFLPGKYQLQFNTADYFRNRGISLSDIPFLDDVIIRFGVDDVDAHYHVPLLVSPYSFSTYRGS